MRSVVMSLACMVGLAACNTSGPDAAFNPAEAAFIKTPGKATIEGHAFLRDKRGVVNVRYAAGEIVRLVPATAYTQARFAHFYGAAKFVPAISIPSAAPDPEYVAYTRTTKAESAGRFTFEDVAPGRYFVTTQLTWQAKDALLAEGGAMYEEVTVTGKETEPIKVVLSGN
ncbi:MAG: carboxypeptidase regulatory-like domain-containing protein [Methylocystis sp.]|nr:carboxypeptidase regulatory-like domain-containing protein [Methylocystis sp.]MBI3274502.1 carboxypeptidase regulatory-like domain-containing protein [Methylocystis sp.]